MQIRFNARWILSSGLLLASVACGDSGGKDSPNNGKCEDDDKCEPDGGNGRDGATNGDGGLLSETCSDGTKNGDETDLDCGGSCNPCSEGLMCEQTSDCLPLGCSTSKGTCSKGAAPGFTISNPGGVVPVLVSVTSTATKGESEITKTEYSWGDSPEFVAGAAHKYRKGGTFEVRQRVTDSDGVEITSDPQTVMLMDFEPVRFSDVLNTDRNSQIVLSADKYSAGISFDKDAAHAVRTNGSVAAGSGVYYFEAEGFVPTSDDDFSSIGVGTAAHKLDQFVAPRGTPAAPAPSFGINVGSGEIETTGVDCTGVVVNPAAGPTNDPRVLVDHDRRHFAFVIDYRAASNPTIHALVPRDDDTLELRRSCKLATSQPLHIIFAGRRSTLGPQMRINTGADITNRPFRWTPAQVTAGLSSFELPGGAAAPADVAGAIQWGFGKTRTPMKDEPPVLTAAENVAGTLNVPVNLTATATDAEDGNLTEEISWADISSPFHARVTAKGGSFTFTPTRIGRFPIEVRVTDLDEVSTVKTVMVTVAGTLPVQAATAVRLQETMGIAADSPNYIDVDATGLTINRAGATKNGARATQAIFQGATNFWYFEARRNNIPANLGAGLVVEGGQINPYSTEQVPWSMSVNMETGIWRNLNSVSSYATPATNNVYGFAVDYRGVHPKVFVIVGNATAPAAAELEWSAELTEVWGPIYPFLYGTVGGVGMASNSTATINFGATPFVFQPARINALLGAEATGMVQRWGN